MNQPRVCFDRRENGENRYVIQWLGQKVGVRREQLEELRDQIDFILHK